MFVPGKYLQPSLTNKHSSLVPKLVNYGEKSFKRLAPDDIYISCFQRNVYLKSAVTGNFSRAEAIPR